MTSLKIVEELLQKLEEKNVNTNQAKSLQGNEEEKNENLGLTPANPNEPFIEMHSYCYKNFICNENKNENNSAFIKYDKNLFTKKVNEYYSKTKQLGSGYAAFCKHIFVPNWIENETNEKINDRELEITNENSKYIVTDYIARRKEELPVLVRWFDKSKLPSNMIKSAKYFDIILYHRTQVAKEDKEMSKANPDTFKYKEPLSEWYIVSIKPQSVDYELPMDPITMMRNALPLGQGGSGVPLDQDKYNQSVQHWKRFATIQ